MTRYDAIERTLRFETEQGQAAWEMLQDGYDGDVEAYIDDYFDDYEADQIDGGWRVTHVAEINSCWIVTEGGVERRELSKLYRVIDNAGDTIIETDDTAEVVVTVHNDPDDRAVLKLGADGEYHVDETDW